VTFRKSKAITVFIENGSQHFLSEPEFFSRTQEFQCLILFFDCPIFLHVCKPEVITIDSWRCPKDAPVETNSVLVDLKQLLREFELEG